MYYSLSHFKDNAKGHFFDKSATRFFNSKLCYSTYKVSPKGTHAYFVTSEAFDSHSPRKYTIRKCDFEAMSVSTVGEFQEFSSRSSALTRIKALIHNE